MAIWFLLAFGSAITNSWTQAIQKWAVFVSRYSKITITFVASGSASLLLFAFSYFIIGLPEIDTRFWIAVFITGILNIVAFPLMLKAYELGEFSSVYSMILLTPVFLLITSLIFLGEVPSTLGFAGVALTVFGFWVIARGNHDHVQVPNFTKGNLLGVLVALIWSVTVNFDKLSAQYSDTFFAPAMAMGLMALGYAGYLLITNRRLFVKNSETNVPNHSSVLAFPRVLILLGLGALLALGSVLHNSALLVGFASYTIAIKRTGVLFGVFWGWLFFHEKNLIKKLLGAAIAISGVIAILFS